MTNFDNSDLSVASGALSAVSSSNGGITWTATLTPTTPLVDATNVITLDNTGVHDVAGNAGIGTTNSNNYAVSTDRAPVGVADRLFVNGPSGTDVTLQNIWLTKNDTDADSDVLNVGSASAGSNTSAVSAAATTTAVSFAWIARVTRLGSHDQPESPASINSRDINAIDCASAKLASLRFMRNKNSKLPIRVK